MEERRHLPRRRVLKGALIFQNSERSSINCVVRDLSDTGARVKLEENTATPDVFDLLIKQDRTLFPCLKVWNKGAEVGVKFTGPSKPVSIQV